MTKHIYIKQDNILLKRDSAYISPIYNTKRIRKSFFKIIEYHYDYGDTGASSYSSNTDRKLLEKKWRRLAKEINNNNGKLRS